MKKRYKCLFLILLILISMNGYQWIKEVTDPFREMIREIKQLDSTVGIKRAEITDFRRPGFKYTISMTIHLNKEPRTLDESDLRKFALEIKKYVEGDKWKQAWIRKEGAEYKGRLIVGIYGPVGRGPRYMVLDSARVPPGETKRLWWWKLQSKWMGRLE